MNDEKLKKKTKENSIKTRKKSEIKHRSIFEVDQKVGVSKCIHIL